MAVQRILKLLRGVEGGSAVEFALVVPIFFGLVFAILHLSIALYAQSTLNSAVEAAARCASVNLPLGNNTTYCDTPGNIQAYALSHYAGPNVSPTFTFSAPTTGTCANMKEVDATGAYHVDIVTTVIPVNLHARSCYP